MKNSYFNCTSQRFSIRKYSFGVASVLLGVFLLSGVQTAHADEQTAVSESTASIKAEPKISAPELAYYDAGNTVNYDSLIQADGHYWISYLSYSGARRYIAIS